jgi:cell division protein FtsL
MYLNGWDLMALFIALTSSITLVVTTAIANARLTRSLKDAQASRDQWRSSYYGKGRNSCENCD